MTTRLAPLALALGRIPCGIYVVTTRAAAGPLGFVGSFVMQSGFEPPSVSIAVGKDRAHLAAIRASGRFALTILDAASSGLMAPFFRRDGRSPFDGLRTATTESGSIVLADGLAWLDCRATGEHETGDHFVVFGEVTAGALSRKGDPKVHLRSNGLDY